MSSAWLLVLSLAVVDEPVEHLERRCLKEAHGASCYKAAFKYAFGLDVGKDLKRAAGLYERSCDLNVWLGCHDIGVMYEQGEAVPKDEQKAAQLYAKQERLMADACARGNQMTCRLLERRRGGGK